MTATEVVDQIDLVWRTDTHLVREIHDDGRLAPAHDGIGGRGLVIVHALCDLVLVHSTPAGTTVRLHMRRGGGT